MHYRKRISGAALCVATTTLTMLVATTAAGAPAGGSAGPDCAVPRDWSSCVQVVVGLDRAPAVGETARLTLDVRALADVRGARIEADLPSALRWQSRPAGWRVDRLEPLLPEDGDGVQRASRAVDLRAGDTRHYTASVRGVAATSTSVRARLVGPAAGPLDDDDNMLLLSVGDTAAGSFLGLDAARNSTALGPLPDALPLVPSASHLAFQAVPARGLAQPHSDDPPGSTASAQAMSCVTGTVGYEFPAGVYDDTALQQRLAGSLLVGDAVDFVAVDSGVRDPGDYYPVVNRPASSTGTGEYRVELAATARLLPDSTTQAMTAPDDVVAVWDTCPVGGTDVTITVTPSDPSQDAELFLMDSDPANPASAVLGRSAGAAESTGGGPNQPESITFTADGGCYGVALVNKAGAGTYTLTRS